MFENISADFKGNKFLPENFNICLMLFYVMQCRICQQKEEISSKFVAHVYENKNKKWKISICTLIFIIDSL